MSRRLELLFAWVTIRMSELKGFLDRAATLHQKMGSDLHQLGGYLICAPGCGERQSLSPEQIAKYLRHGWPKHCGHTMQWITAKLAVAEHAAPPSQEAGTP